MTRAELQAKFEAKLAESGLDLKDARKLGLKLYTAEQFSAELRRLPVHRAGFRIPYFDINGKPTKFFRFRYLDCDQNGSQRLVGAKPLRYCQPAGTLNEVYMPPYRNWAELSLKTALPIFLTEGEVKAAAATKAGFPTLGLGGVWCWRSTAKGLPSLPALQEFNWKGRVVSIVFDSDAATNPDVVMAENALCRELTHLGARPQVVRLPALSRDSKTGLDDYLVAKGPDAFMALLEKNSEPWAAAKELYALNEEVVYVRQPGVIVRLDNNQVIDPHAFVNHAYSNRRYSQPKTNANGDTRLEEKSAPKEWLSWKHRLELEKMTYRPGADHVIAARELNLWRGLGCEPKKGDTSPWHELWEFLTNGEPGIRRWINDWWAYPLQHLGVKLHTCLILWGAVHGTGKSLVGLTMGDIYGAGERRNFVEVNSKQLFSDFNSHIACKQLVMGTEITTKGHRDAGDHLKMIITQELALIRPLYVNAYLLEDHCNYYFTSNHPDALYMEDSDRRNTVVEVVGDPLPDKFYRDYATWRAAGGPSHLLYEFLERDLSEFNPKGHAPTTQAKQEMISLGRSDVGDWVAQLRDTPDIVLKHRDMAVEGSLFSTEELYNYFSDTRNGDRSRRTA